MANSLHTCALKKKQRSEDWIGATFGHLKIIKCDGLRQYSRGRGVYFTFACVCGRTFSAQKSNIKGKREHCGCLGKQVPWTAPSGYTRHPIASTWKDMITRCLNQNSKSYRDYGGRGISVCQRWISGEDGLTGFECFIQDMGPRTDGLTIERDDFNGNYEPNNCRWATKAEQGKNCRGVALYTINGVTKTLPDWCLEYGIKYFTARARILRGMDPILALTTPLLRK